ncbi:MAG: TIGR00341 family protein [Rhodoferax sp.]
MPTRSLKLRLMRRFDLRADQAAPDAIDASIRSGVEFRGTNLWVLMFAIVVASVGLNVNSTAVIIGAMLISPLMGPIMALGYGAGINDSGLMRSALFNLGLATLISLITSTLYFLLTPLTQADSELLARTTPSIWDVLIALFGGLAGIIGMTRREKSNLIPGVAIATALMPPLCTAGYGLATGHWSYFAGALYLYTINAVFIAIATLIMVRVMRLPSLKDVEGPALIKQHTVVGLVVLATLIPSVILAVQLVQREWFDANTQRFVRQVIKSRPDVLVVSQEPRFKDKTLRVDLIGERLSDKDRTLIEQRLPEFGLAGVKLDLVQSGQVVPDVSAVKRDVLNEFLQTTRADIAERDARIAALQSELASLKQASARDVPLRSIQRELLAQFPQASDVRVAWGVGGTPAPGGTAAAADAEPSLLWVQITLPAGMSLSAEEQRRLRDGLRVRAGLKPEQTLALDVTAAPAPPATAPKKSSRNARK